MKRLLIAGLLGSALACSSPEVHLDIQYDLGEKRTLGPEDAARVALSLEELLRSCTIDASGGPEHVGNWSAAIRGAHVTVNFEEPVETTVRGRPVQIEQILLPVPDDHLPDYVWMRAGGKLRSLTKYRPDALADVVCDEAVGLQDVPLYGEFCERFFPSAPLEH